MGNKAKVTSDTLHVLHMYVMIDVASDLDEDVAVQNHEVLGHLGRNLDLVFLQLCIHAEEDVMRCAVVAWCRQQTIFHTYRTYIYKFKTKFNRHMFTICIYIMNYSTFLFHLWDTARETRTRHSPPVCSSLAMMMAVLAASRNRFSDM